MTGKLDTCGRTINIVKSSNSLYQIYLDVMQRESKNQQMITE